MRVKSAPKFSAAWITILAVLHMMTVLPAAADGVRARLEGLIMGVDGRAATGHRVHLIDERGQAVGQVTTTLEGSYSFKDLSAGGYFLGVICPA